MLTRLRTEGLTALWSVDAVEADLFHLAGDQNLNAVSVQNGEAQGFALLLGRRFAAGESCEDEDEGYKTEAPEPPVD